jgi:hypothetical protein
LSLQEGPAKEQNQQTSQGFEILMSHEDARRLNASREEPVVSSPAIKVQM